MAKSPDIVGIVVRMIPNLPLQCRNMAGNAHQQGQMAIMNMTAELEGLSTGSLPNLRADTFELDKTFRTNPSAMVFGIVGKKGEPAREVNFEAGEIWTQDHYNRMEEGYKNGVSSDASQRATSPSSCNTGRNSRSASPAAISSKPRR